MNTAHKTDQEKMEFFDPDYELDDKVSMLAEWIVNSQHFVVFTGAGISTSAGIPDFRSGINTVLPTGPGAWEKLATKTKAKSTIEQPLESAIPTPCHMTLVRLMEAGYLKFIVSQNTDGLHRKSGVPSNMIAELHGNINLEVCKNPACQRQYLRDFIVQLDGDDHKTGRYCENCGQELHDSIIHFKENLPERELKLSFEQCEKADLCLVLGSSLRVTPAADMPASTSANGGRLAIVNLQPTPLDDQSFRINGLVDDVLMRLMDKLGLNIPEFILTRRMMVMKCDEDIQNPGQKMKPYLVVRGVDEEGYPYSLFRAVTATFWKSREKIIQKENEPFRILPAKSSLEKGVVKLQMVFQGNYDEPALEFDVDLESIIMNEPAYYMMEFDPRMRKWISCQRVSLV